MARILLMPTRRNKSDLVVHRHGMLALGISGGKDMVPEERDLLFQRAFAVDHAVDPRADVDLRSFAAEVALQDILVGGRAALRLHQILDDLVVPLLGVRLQLLSACAKAGPAQQVGNQAQIMIRHVFLLTSLQWPVVGGQWSVVGVGSDNDVSTLARSFPFR